jgi:glutamate synthase (NADPH) large chain
LGLDMAAVRRRIARGARVEVGRVSDRDEEAISALLHAYVSALSDSEQHAEAQRVSSYMTGWLARFVKVVPTGQLLDQEISTE